MKRIKMYFKRLLDLNNNVRPQERMFKLLITFGMIGFAIAIVTGLINGENVSNLRVTMMFYLVLSIIVLISIMYHKFKFCSVLLGIAIVCFILPLNFVTSGGLDGGGVIWFVFGLVYVCLVVEGVWKSLLLVAGFLMSTGCYILARLYPARIVEHTEDVKFLDSYVSYVLVITVICVMILFQNKISKTENEIARRQKKEIEELSEAQNRFFSNMSHEIRTPINTIIGLNEMILREDVSEEVASDARSIQGASKMLLSLINDILDMSKMESGKMDIVETDYSMGNMLSDIVNMIWIRAKEKNLEFHVDVDETFPSRLRGDDVRIRQILINVLNNAVKYTKEGSVTLSLSCLRKKDNQAEITYSISDTGMGIRKEALPYLFSAFKRVDEEKNRYIEGTGLGLSIVKQLVDLMGGSIKVNSVYTKGSTFVITIPQEIVGNDELGEISLDAKHEFVDRERYRQSFEAPKAHILIVDDNQTNVMVEEKLLRATKVQIETAFSGKECLEKTVRNRYDLILMDHLMPEMDGVECFHAIREQSDGLNLRTPVVILTANAGSENQKIYRREGFDGYLLKPVRGADLENEVVKHLPAQLVSRPDTDGDIGIVESNIVIHEQKAEVIVTSESVSDLPEWMREKFQIPVIPFRVVSDKGEFLDLIEAETDGVLYYMKKGEGSIVSEEPTVEDFVEFFANQLTKAQNVLHFSMSTKVSKSYHNAVEAASQFENVRVFDSGNLSSGIGLMALEARERLREGMSIHGVIENLERSAGFFSTSFIVDSTEYLRKVGRISPRIDDICHALMIHPIIYMKNSQMKVADLCVGTRQNAWDKYIERCLRKPHYINKKILFITYSGVSMEDLQWIKAEVEKKVKFEEVVFQKASPANATNCGPGSFGLIFERLASGNAY